MQKDSLKAKVTILEEVLHSLNNFVLAFSGGVDSSLLAVMAKEVLGRENFLAVTAAAPIFPQFEINEAKEFAEIIGIKHQFVYPKILEKASFVENPPNRCYYCKKVIAEELLKIAAEEGYNHVVDGTNAEDAASDFRPGIKAAKELKIKSPLKDAGFDKEDIRQLSKEKGIVNWDKPSNACLASRVPYGSIITSEKLLKIEKAEDVLRNLGTFQVRVRHHDNIARIEVSRENFETILENSNKITVEFKKLNFKYVTLDLEGYKTGSLNTEVKNDSEK
ncbi:ATP-dependent sacrificial sulfur transferase LarE [Natranaerofaba carboxydovora]|uniref:ATP-dependent sacrificial sulfur transferase LarE n=1 Tax=Natranaerofaba carboxydovora TaxID=2742683 RepID=UPI001F1371D8|nr:ATP-dependent sacrificial sulfur transferase LarE [Natranaerofaba carboxydovora]UMZ72590.1 NAD synthase [Natranaerofaba carboxydovora]